MNDARLATLLSSFLGPGQKRKKHYYFRCPACNHPNNKLLVQVERDPEPDKDYPWVCFHCQHTNKTAGKKLKSLLTRFNAPKPIQDEIIKLLNLKVSTTPIENNHKPITLPKEFIPLYGFKSDDIYEMNFYDRVLTYLVDERGLSIYDILKYNIGMCLTGPYNKMIIIPSYSENNVLNYFIGRFPHDDYKMKYRNADYDKTKIIPFENTINWKEPIILVEGPFDMISVKRNCIPLLGKTISDHLMTKLVSEEVEKIYICLDSDARASSFKHCERLLNFGKEVYLVELDGKDPNEIGFEKVNECLQHTEPLTHSDLLHLKLRGI